MTGADKFSVQFKGGGPEGDLNTQVAFDEVAQKIDDIETRMPNKATGEESEGGNLVPLEATINRNLDPQGRLLNVSGKIPQGKGPVRYRLFTNDVNVGDGGVGRDDAVKLSIGKQWNSMEELHSGDTPHFRRIEINAFVGIAYNIPWHGHSYPTTYSGPFISGSAPRCGRIYVNSGTATSPVWAEAANAEGSTYLMRDKNIVGTWDPMGGSSFNSSMKINSTTDASSYVEVAQSPEIAVQWGIMPFFFRGSEEPELKKFLEDIFYSYPNNSATGGDDGAPGATGISDGFVQSCLTTKKTFPALIWSRLLLGVSTDNDMDRSLFWTAQTVNYPGNLDADRPKWTVDVLGSQDIVVT